MDLIKKFFGTSSAEAAISVLVFFVILGITVAFILKVSGFDNGQLNLKSFSSIRKNFMEHIKEFAVSLLVTIFIFSVLGVTGLLNVAFALLGWIGLLVKAFVEWLIDNLPSV